MSEKQDLLCQASKAIELLDEQQKNQYDKSQSTIDTLNEKVELLTKEVHNLKSKAGRPSGVNDTGFAEFLGAVEHRENQRVNMSLISRVFCFKNIDSSQWPLHYQKVLKIWQKNVSFRAPKV